MAQITALMTSYNGAKYIRETIDSVLAQTFRDFVFLIVDDGSTDETVSVIKSYKDERIKLHISKENRGVGYQLKEATKYIETPYIVKIDSDDISKIDRFEKQYKYMKENPDIDISKCYFSYFADDKLVENSSRFKEYKNTKEKEHNSIDSSDLIHTNLPRWLCVCHTTYFAKTSTIKEVGYTDSRYAEDYSLFYRALMSGYKFDCLKENLVKTRVHNSSATTHQNTSDLYTKTVLEFKKSAIEKLAKNHKELLIYGTGGLGKAAAKWLIGNGYKFAGFLDRNPSDLIDKHSVKSIYSNNKKGILICAQPVRFEIKNILENQAMIEWEDFMIVA